MTRARSSGQTISLQQLTKTYARGRAPANRDISLSFQPGELIALIGHNGAGKTTLLNQIIGTTKPTGGDVQYGTRSLVAAPDLARRVSSMMPQIHAPLTGVTPVQAIASIARLRGLSSKWAKLAALDLLETLDIAAWKNTGGEKLSGGLRRLTSYAMAVVAPAPILLIDEPTNDVDPVRRPLIWRHLRRLADAGHIVIVVTHNLLEVERTADRYVLLQEGSVLMDSTPHQLADQVCTTSLTISARPGNDLGTAPPAVSISHDDEGGQTRLTLTAEQVPQAVAWVLQLTAQEQVESYSLAPASLETLYEGITNGR